MLRYRRPLPLSPSTHAPAVLLSRLLLVLALLAPVYAAGQNEVSDAAHVVGWAGSVTVLRSDRLDAWTRGASVGWASQKFMAAVAYTTAPRDGYDATLSGSLGVYFGAGRTAPTAASLALDVSSGEAGRLFVAPAVTISHRLLHRRTVAIAPAVTFGAGVTLGSAMPDPRAFVIVGTTVAGGEEDMKVFLTPQIGITRTPSGDERAVAYGFSAGIITGLGGR